MWYYIIYYFGIYIGIYIYYTYIEDIPIISNIIYDDTIIIITYLENYYNNLFYTII